MGMRELKHILLEAKVVASVGVYPFAVLKVFFQPARITTSEAAEVL